MFIENLFTNSSYFISTVLIVIFSVVIHELAHAFMALNQGDSTAKDAGHLTLNPIKHMGVSGIVFLLLFGIAWGVTPVNPANFKYPKLSPVFVSLAGPLSNLILGFCFVAFFVLKASFASHNVFHAVTIGQDLTVFVDKILYLGALINFVLFLFNLVPLPPLDGFKACEELIPPLKAIGANSGVSLVILLILFNIPGFWSSIFKIAENMISFCLKILAH